MSEEVQAIKAKAEELNVLLINLHRQYQSNNHLPLSVAHALADAISLVAGNMVFMKDMAEQSIVNNATATLVSRGFIVTDKNGNNY